MDVLVLKFGIVCDRTDTLQSDVDLAILLDRSNVTLENTPRFFKAFSRSSKIRGRLDLALIHHADPSCSQEDSPTTAKLLYGPLEKLQALETLRLQAVPGPSQVSFEMERRFAERFLTTTQAGR